MQDNTTFLSLADAAKRVPTSSGRPPSTMTLYRWITKGVHGVVLEHRRFGRRIAVTPEALDRFSRALAEVWSTTTANPPAQSHDKPKRRSTAQRARAVEAAEKELHDAGMM